MMEFKVKKEATNIGIIKLDNLTLNEDSLQVYVDICDMSDELKAVVNKAIELEKVRFSKEWDEILLEREASKRWSTVWSYKPVEIDYCYLGIVLEAGKPIKYTINTGFHDVENARLDPVASFDVDLSEYEYELGAAIIHALIDKFFVRAK